MGDICGMSRVLRKCRDGIIGSWAGEGEWVLG